MSLLEILSAAALFSLLSAASAGIIWRTFVLKETISEISDHIHSARVVLDRIARELSMAYISRPSPAIVDKSRIPLTLFLAKDEAPISRLTFTTFGHVRMLQNARESDQALIEYYGKPNPKQAGLTILMRRTKTVIDHQPEQGGIALTLLENVVRLEFRYWDKRKNDWSRTWDTQRIEDNNLLPSLVEIRLTVRDKDKQDLTFITASKIFMNRVVARF